MKRETADCKRIGRMSTVLLGGVFIAGGAMGAIVGASLSPACMGFVQPAQARVSDISVGGFDADGNLVDGGRANVQSGSVRWNPSSSTLTLDNARVSSDDWALYIGASSRDAVKVNLVGQNVLYSKSSGAVSSDAALEFVGDGSLEMDGTDYALASDADVTVTSGTLSVTGNSYGIESSGLNMSGGELSVTSGDYGLFLQGPVKMSGGTLEVEGTNFGLRTTGGMTVSGGTLTATSQRGGGISVDGTFRQSAGTTRATGGSYGLYAGETDLVGGKLSASGPNMAIGGGRVSNSISCLGEIKGTLGEGASFRAGGSEYRSVDGYGKARLVKYGGSSKKPTVNRCSFGNVGYKVSEVGSKAFSNKRGKVVTKLTLGANVEKIAANSFSGTRKLKMLDLRKVRYLDSSFVSKNAFKGCGKGNGKNLTVKVPDVKYMKKYYKRVLVKKGLSKKARIA